MTSLGLPGVGEGRDPRLGHLGSRAAWAPLGPRWEMDGRGCGSSEPASRGGATAPTWGPQTGPRPALRPQTSPDLPTGPGAASVTLADRTLLPRDKWMDAHRMGRPTQLSACRPQNIPSSGSWFCSISHCTSQAFLSAVKVTRRPWQATPVPSSQPSVHAHPCSPRPLSVPEGSPFPHHRPPRRQRGDQSLEHPHGASAPFLPGTSHKGP